jgi:hypothetical protein
MKSKHPQKQCTVCGINVYYDEFEKHLLDSWNHKTCHLCNVGFETDGLYDEVRHYIFIFVLSYFFFLH